MQMPSPPLPPTADVEEERLEAPPPPPAAIPPSLPLGEP